MSYKRFDPQGARLADKRQPSARFLGVWPGSGRCKSGAFDESFFAFLRSIFTLAAEEKEEIYV
ncbi:MAG: hypothetical protein LUO83_08785 [Methanothrix sp.]|nr:hypothetical protein [Methanothrix sp.]